MIYEKYLKKNLFDKIFHRNSFKNIDIKNVIINNEDKIVFNDFCNDEKVTSDMLCELLDDVGIEVLKTSHNYLEKVKVIISCGKNISNLFDNRMFLDMLVELGAYYNYFDCDCALKFVKYCIELNYDILKVFDMFSGDVQTYIINNCDLSKYYYDLLLSSKVECSKVIVDKISSLDNYDYYDLLCIFEKDMVIPNRLLDNSLIEKISSMYNVKNYRNLINQLGKNNDVSEIEKLRRTYYDNFLENCLKIYNSVISDVQSGKNVSDTLKKYYNNFGGFDFSLDDTIDNRKFDRILKKSLKRITTDIVVDYVFNDFTYNVFLDINELVKFSMNTGVLSVSDRNIYSEIASLDIMSINEKKDLLEKLKKMNMSTKFYDDYKSARDKMVELFNNSILNKDNVIKYKNVDLSNQYGVPIYEMNGNEFYVFVKSVLVDKHSVLDDDGLKAYRDCASFSIDGSNKLETFCDTNSYYNLAYNNIPNDQLIHVFEVDSGSNYYRDKNNIPCDGNGTSKVNRLYTPQEFVGTSSSYNELVVAQPNDGKSDEFNSKLERPVPFAIYCYDNICDNDIISAKRLGLGIIVVRTNKYNIDKINRISKYSISDKNVNYVKPNENEDIYGRRL